MEPIAMNIMRVLMIFPILLAVFAGGVTMALAQNLGGAFNGMRDSDQPINIEADRLEVTDETGMAVFHGNVSVVQGSTNLRTTNLRVFYARTGEGQAGNGGAVRRIEASGGVAVRSRDQMASADKAVVDMQSQIATLSGDVSVSQGSNIITGCVVTLNMRTNNIDVKPCGGRVKVLIDRAPGGG
jgi:lipopolysaccharide export system protein LptA